jgi:hypothetical protein
MRETKKEREKILIAFYRFGEWTVLTIIGEYYSFTKLELILTN